MKTNKEKWCYYRSFIDDKVEAFIKSTGIKGGMVGYKVNPNGSLSEFVFGEPNIPSLYYNIPVEPKRVTRQMVKDIESISNDNTFYREDNIRVPYERKSEFGISSGSEKVSGLVNYLSRQEAEAKSRLVVEVQEKEARMLESGSHKRCSYCIKVYPVVQNVSSKIIFRDRKNGKAFVNSKYMDFCSGNCAVNEQMSREG